MNTLTDVERQAKLLMAAHGLEDIPFRFTNGTKAIAVVRGYRTTVRGQRVNYEVRDLGISRRWAQALPQDELYEVMLHEIAHILSVRRYGLNIRPHGVEFRTTVRAIGGSYKVSGRCFKPSVNIDGTPRG
jgi:predicted SprT family Zn-dependent metalloprotease